MSDLCRDRRLREATMIVATAVAVIMMMRMVVIVPDHAHPGQPLWSCRCALRNAGRASME